jgi:hypothetical protein
VRLPRFRVRTLMVLVGVVALLIAGSMMGLRSYVYYRLASTYSRYERDWRIMARRDLDRGDTRSVSARWGLQIAEFYAPLAQKYRRAMWRPWMPVAPDPPAPIFQ